MSRLERIGDTCRGEFPKNWEQTSLPQVLGQLFLLRCGWLHEADFALNISDKWLESKRRLCFTWGISNGRKKNLCNMLQACVSLSHGRRQGRKWLSETRQNACLQKNREKQVVSPSPSHGKLTTWLCQIRNAGVPHTSLEMSRAERIMDSGFRGDLAGHAFWNTTRCKTTSWMETKRGNWV